MPVSGSGASVSSWSLLVRGILAAFRQKLHLSNCPNLPGHLLGWAWEFLRRCPEYRVAYERHGAHPIANPPAVQELALHWGLLRFEDPGRSALDADVFWRMKACRQILPLAAGAMRPGTAAESKRPVSHALRGLGWC